MQENKTTALDYSVDKRGMRTAIGIGGVLLSAESVIKLYGYSYYRVCVGVYRCAISVFSEIV